MQVIIEHPSLGPQETRLSADAAASATSSTVENTKSFATNDYVVFGVPGEELSEIVLLTGTSGSTTLSHSAGLTFAHAARTPISQIKYNQAKIYRATSEDGSYSLVTTVNLTVDDKNTVYDDTDGSTSSWYKIKYYNSTTTVASAYSVAVQGSGYDDDSLKSMTDEVLEELSDPECKEISKDQVHNHLNAGVRKLTAEILKSYPDYLRTYTTQDLTADDATYALPTGFLGFVRVDVNFNGTAATDAYKAKFISEEYGEADTTYYTSEPYVAIRGTDFVLRPTPTTTGRAFIWYWAAPTTMTEDNDEHGLPYGARDVLVNYALYRIWLSKDRDTALTYKTLFKDSFTEYMDFLSQPRQTMTSRSAGITFGVDLYDEEI